jgi:LacI family transcriptional regulator
MRGIPKVALLIETARGYGRGLLRGIMRYARLHGPWAFYVTPGDLRQVLPAMEHWGATGIIARIETRSTAQRILATGLPLIALDLSQEQLARTNPLSQVCEICPDSHKAGRMAAEHLLQRGLRQFAFAGVSKSTLWSSRREEGFCERLAESGCTCHIYRLPELRRDRHWGREQAVMSRWLRGLPLPIGLLACDDDRGREVLEACRAAELRVPADVAVLGVDNDELLCELSDPPLSSVALNLERGGYEAAALLDRLMSGQARAPQRILVEPTWVVTRRSSDVLALEDRSVATALHFIHDNAGRPIGVLDVVRHSGCSRRTLEMRFRAALGRSLHDEIQRTRLERAKRLLVETDLPVGRIAAASGFASPDYLTRVFHSQIGLAPAEYRRQAALPTPV